MSDLISRQDAIDAISKAHFKNYGNAIMVIQDLPSAEPERATMVLTPAKGRPAYEKGICNCGYVLSVLQRDFVYCPMCEARLDRV